MRTGDTLRIRKVRELACRAGLLASVLKLVDCQMAIRIHDNRLACLSLRENCNR